MDKAEATGWGIAAAGHLALLALLSMSFATATRERPVTPPMEVSFVEEVDVISAVPEPAAEAPAQSVAPELGPPEEAAPSIDPVPAPPEPLPPPPAPVVPPPQPKPQIQPAPRPIPPEPKAEPQPPKPKPVPAPPKPAPTPVPTPVPAPPKPAPKPAPAPPKPAPKPAPPQRSTPAPPKPAPPKASPAPAPAAAGATKAAPARPAPAKAAAAPAPTPAKAAAGKAQTIASGAGSAQQTRGARLGSDFLKGIGSDPTPSVAQKPAAAAMNASAKANITSAITRQVQPCADRQVNPGPGAERIQVTINLRLNRDGSLAARPRVVGRTGVNDENERYADRVEDLAVATFVGCAPLRGLPAELYDVSGGWSNFSLRYKLPD